MFKLGSLSKQRLIGVHPDLVKVVERAIEVTTVDFCVLEGLRTQARQRKLYEARASRTMNSRHITGHAVDLGALMDGKITWAWPPYNKIYEAMSEAAKELNIPIEWGGNWKSFKDGPHYQLPWSKYPTKP